MQHPRLKQTTTLAHRHQRLQHPHLKQATTDTQASQTAASSSQTGNNPYTPASQTAASSTMPAVLEKRKQNTAPPFKEMNPQQAAAATQPHRWQHRQHRPLQQTPQTQRATTAQGRARGRGKLSTLLRRTSPPQHSHRTSQQSVTTPSTNRGPARKPARQTPPTRSTGGTLAGSLHDGRTLRRNQANRLPQHTTATNSQQPPCAATPLANMLRDGRQIPKKQSQGDST